MLKKVLMIVIIVFVLIVALGCTKQEEEEETDETTGEQTEELSLVKKTKKEGALTIEYPEASGLTSNQKDLLNNSVQNFLDHVIQEVKDSKIEQIGYIISYKDTSELSLIFQGKKEMGGEDGEYLNSFNYDLSKNKRVTLDTYIDLKDNENKEKLNRFLARESGEQLGKEIVYQKGMEFYFENMNDEKNVVFYLKEKEEDLEYKKIRALEEDVQMYTIDELSKK